MLRHLALVVSSFLILNSSFLFSADPTPALLWPDGAPGAMGDTDKDKPSVTIYRPEADKATKACVVVFPGGGYGALAMGHEGLDVARWLNSHGITAAVTKYRLSPYRHPIPLGDAQRAIRTVRSQAAALGLDPQKIGVLGFSAGGHLASTTITKFDAGKSEASDPIEQQSCRPDFGVLVYPVISFTQPCTHVGSRNNLLGKDASPELIESLSNEKQVKKDTPPTFLMHTGGDTGVPPENSILFYQACRAAGVPVEMHIYEQGQHGFGLAPKDPILSTWPDRCIGWLRVRGMLPKP